MYLFFIVLFLMSCADKDYLNDQKTIGVEVDKTSSLSEVVLNIDNPNNLEVILLKDHKGYKGEQDNEVTRFHIPDVNGEYELSVLKNGYTFEDSKLDLSDLDKVYRVVEILPEAVAVNEEVQVCLSNNIRSKKEIKYKREKKKKSIYSTFVSNKYDGYLPDSYQKKEDKCNELQIDPAREYVAPKEDCWNESLLFAAIGGSSSEKCFGKYYSGYGKESKEKKQFREELGKFCTATYDKIGESLTTPKKKEEKDD